jgi:hypothetical protein
MIGKTFSITENKQTRTLSPEEEFYQYGKRFYNVRDSKSPKELVPYVADDFDTRFKTSGKINKRRGFHAKYRERKAG